MKKVKALLYCTKAKPYLVKDDFPLENEPIYFTHYKEPGCCGLPLNGKIVAECDCEKTEKISCCCVPYRNYNNLGYEYFLDNGVYKVEWKENINLVDEEKIYNNPENYKEDGVVFERSDRYIDSMFKNEDLKKMCLLPQQLLDYIKLGKNGYALHLSNIKIFDKSKGLNDYNIEKAPQNMMRVFDANGNKYILISVQSEWLCKILNGDKTIEVRKKVLKEMLE